MSERVSYLCQNVDRRIKWTLDHGDLHILWPSQIEEWELEGIEAMFAMALKQMTRLAKSRPEASGNPVSSDGLPSNELSQPKTAGPTDGE